MVRSIQKFLHTESGAGLFLFSILCLALIVANSSCCNFYHQLLDLPIQIQIGEYSLNKPALLWINEGLMTLFFMGLALEIKQEMIVGHLSSIRKTLLPCFAALGGVLTPMLIYFLCTHGHEEASRGWPIPTATDVALSLGAAAALGSRVPGSLRTFLMALAIIDDVVAIIIIALVYTGNLAMHSLLLGSIGILALLVLNFFNVRRITPYLLVGLFIWFCVLQSGIHATLTGVIVGFAIPFDRENPQQSPLVRLNTALKPWVTFFILPLFIFWNGGLEFGHFQFADLITPVSLGIILGLCVGKTVGIFGASWLAIKLKLAHRPHAASWFDVLGIAALGGIGFTMSLFLASLAFHGSEFEIISRQGILVGSVLSLVVGSAVFLVRKRSS